METLTQTSAWLNGPSEPGRYRQVKLRKRPDACDIVRKSRGAGWGAVFSIDGKSNWDPCRQRGMSLNGGGNSSPRRRAKAAAQIALQ